jgi:hypothetical protein
MKTILSLTAFSAILLTFIVGLVSCNDYDKESKENKKAMSNLNLTDYESVDPMRLVGDWELIKFAYTEDENRITDIRAISECSSNSISITEAVSVQDDDLPDYAFSVFFKVCKYAYSLKSLSTYDLGPNYVLNQKESFCFAVLVPYTDDEIEIDNALRNIYSFFIKDDELIIQFARAKDKNLLILKKR